MEARPRGRERSSKLGQKEDKEGARRGVRVAGSEAGSRKVSVGA